jgi:diguanylate cyclase (GGDEF) domain
MVSFISRNRLRNRVEELTFYDENGYKNLRSFYKYIMDEKENMGGKAALRYNLRHFTLVNQELGMKVGDNVIKTHFETLSNIIGDEGIVCRLGGDNFVAICGERQIGNVLNYLTETPVVYEPHEGKCINVATSTGVLRIPHDYVVKDIGDIMSKVIPAYQTAQTGGKERIVFYDVSLMKDKERSMKVQQMFPEALRNEEFAVYYQPKVNIKTGELIGAEALCRWIHNGEVISPAQFIPMLEETDDICKLDFYVLDHVCRDIRRWIEQGKHVVRISVNLSRKHMMNRNLLQSILKIIDRHEIPHSLIEVELTETTTDVEFSDLKRVVSGLQSFGIYTAVDDFGVGYSSLNLLRELPWNVIKIDRSFLPTEKDEDVSSRNTMFKYVVAMARELGMECIVEGVETEQQLSMLIDNSCDFAQGFMYDKPLPKMEFEDRINKRFYQI